MVNAADCKKRLNAIADAATRAFNAHKTKMKDGKAIPNNYDFSPAARALAQEAFDLGRGAVKNNIEEPIEVDHQDELAETGAPQVDASGIVSAADGKPEA